MTDIKILQCGNGLALDFLGRILSDFGLSVYKTADIVELANATHLDNSKTILKQSLSNINLSKFHAVCLHQDLKDVQNIANGLHQSYPHLIILILHRINQNTASAHLHDANLQAISSILSQFGQTDNQKDNTPQYAPMMATLVGVNGAAISLMKALFEMRHSKIDRIIHHSILHSAMYLNSFNLNSHLNGMIRGLRGTNVLDGAAPYYRIYKTKNHWLTVGNIQPKFYQEMLKALKFEGKEYEYLVDNQMNEEQWPKIKNIFQEVFKTKTTEDWLSIFQSYDTCIGRVASLYSAKEIETWPRLSKYSAKL